jgi:hypothetical protein
MCPYLTIWWGLTVNANQKMRFSPGWNVIFRQSAWDGYAALITRYLPA